MIELALHSDRRAALPAAARDLGAVGLRDVLSVAGFTPAFFASSYLATLFLPLFAIVAAAAAFGEPEKRRLVVLLGLFAAAGVLLASAAPPGPWLRAVAPLDRIRYAGKGLVFTAFSVAMLAGLGLDALRFAPSGPRRRAVFGLLAVGALAAAAFAPLPYAVRLACAVGSAAVGLLALFGGSARSGAGVPGALLAGTAAAALVAALALGLSGVPRFAPEASVRMCPPEVEPLARVAGRIVTPPMAELAAWALGDGNFGVPALARQRGALLGYTNLTCKVPTVRTAAPMPTAAAAAIEASLAGAQGVLPAGAAGARALWTPFPPEGLPARRVGEFYRAPLAPYRPRLSFVRSYRVEPDSARAWQRVASGGVDPAREVLLDRRPDPEPAPPSSSATPLLLARFAEDRPEEVVAELTTSNAGLLVLTDLHYPGWTAEAGGKRLPILRADGWFRAVALPAGTHRVVFRYRPLVFYAGAAISAATILTILILWHRGEPLRRRRFSP